MKIILLASGSDGNCIFIGEGDHGILVDAGISRRRIIQGLKSFNIDPGKIDGVFLTHEHGDHVRGLEILSKYENYPVYGSRGTIEKLRRRFPGVEFRQIFQETQLNGLTIKSMPVPHDAEEPLCYIIENGSSRLMVATDMGYVTPRVLSEIKHCHGLIFESNHDVEMLRNGPYPADLQRRILSRWGHLSNAQCAAALREASREELQFVTLAHLSEKNNLPEIALRENEEVLPPGTKLIAADRYNPTGPIFL